MAHVTCKVCVMGDGGVGKTALTIQMCSHRFVESYDPTIEDSYRTTVTFDDREGLLEIVDTAGQEEFVTLRDQWIRDCDAFLLVYSVVDRSSFDVIQELKGQIERVKNGNIRALSIVGNKCDLAEDYEPHEGDEGGGTEDAAAGAGHQYTRAITQEEAQALADEWKCHFLETSARTRYNVERAFLDMLRHFAYDRCPICSAKGGQKARTSLCVIL